MPADFLANDFGAIARAVRWEISLPPAAVLHFWNMLTVLASTHESVKAAIEEACALTASHTVILHNITASDGTVLMDDKALAEAVTRYREGMPI